MALPPLMEAAVKSHTPAPTTTHAWAWQDTPAGPGPHTRFSLNEQGQG